MNTNLKQIISRLIKRADDMALNPGEVDYANRQGLRWHRLFMGGQFSGTDSLPQGATSQVQKMMQDFKASYSGESGTTGGNTTNDYSGMLFVIYAKDTALTDHVKRALPPELKATADFVEKNHVRLIQPGDHSKNIGSPFWQSWNGQAYASLFPDKVQNVGNNRAAGLVSLRSPEEVQVYKGRGWAAGKLVAGRSEKGFGPFIDSDGQMVSALIGQEPQNQRKLFVDKVQPGSTAVELRGSSASSLRQSRLRGARKENPNEIQDQYTRKEKARQSVAQGNAYVLFADESGALYGKQISEIRGDKYAVTSEARYLTQPEVESLLNPSERIGFIGVMPQKGDTKEKTGPWKMSDDLAAALEEGGQLSNQPFSFTNLRNLRSVADQSHQLEYGQAGGQMHSPYEGFKLIMIGPIFSNPDYAGSQTESNSNLVKPVHMSDPSQPEQPWTLNRGVQWVVVMNEVRPNTGSMDKPWTQARGANESHVFPSATAAVRYVMGSYVDESVQGNEQLLNELARSVQVADNKLRSASGQSPLPIMRPKPKAQPSQIGGPVTQVGPRPSPSAVEQSFQQPIGNMQPSIQNTASSRLKYILKRIKG